MKSYIEITNDLLNRRDKYIAEQKKKRKITAYICASLSVICILSLSVYGIWKMRQVVPVPPAVSGSAPVNKEPPPPGNATVLIPPETPVIWGDLEGEDLGFSEWHGKNVRVSLLYAFEKNPDGSVFAISARPYRDWNYVYNGRTLSEYLDEVDKERTLPAKLAELLKIGETLKYGEALYLTGTPDGEKWSKEFYDNTIQYYGKDLLDKYFTDGEFLRENVEADMNSGENKAQKAYEDAYHAYLEHVYEATKNIFNAQNIYSEYRPGSDYYILYATEEEFAALSVDNGSDWDFGIARRNEA